LSLLKAISINLESGNH